MYFRKGTTLQTLQIHMTMKRNILLLMILTVISLGASGQKYTIYVDDFDSEIKIPNRAINLIRLAFIDGIRNTNRINVVDAVSAVPRLELPLEAIPRGAPRGARLHDPDLRRHSLGAPPWRIGRHAVCLRVASRACRPPSHAGEDNSAG